ncbi:MAG: AAA family ATPase [Firmicutes bacterium]|nr:AAA family ATPase [Bacillota bacterium]
MPQENNISKTFIADTDDSPIFNSVHNIFIAIDARGRITIFNTACEEAFNIASENAVGRLVTEVVPYTGLIKVLKTGKSHIGRKFLLGNTLYIANRTPIVRKGAIVGAVGVAQEASEIQQLAEERDYYKHIALAGQTIAQEGFGKNNHYSCYRGKQSNCRYNIENLIGCSDQMEELKHLIRKVGKGPSSILITGESGTGKELVAQALHTQSARGKRAFIRVNCAAVPENLLESELFGYREGAFTGSRKGGQKGKFELAHGGTILLDEIGDMPLSMQAKLLRVLQEKEVQRLGDSKTIPIDVRVIASTNQDVMEMVNSGTFRQDLYYRINVINLCLPTLRERLDDLDLLVDHFINKFNIEFELEIKGVTEEVWNLFAAYGWPGNVRELENMIERAFNLVEGNYIEIKHLPNYMQRKKGEAKRDNNHLPVLVEEVEKRALTRALSNSNGNKARAAKELGISRAWLYKKLKYYNIQIP